MPACALNSRIEVTLLRGNAVNCGSGLAREGGVSDNDDVKFAAPFANKPAPTVELCTPGDLLLSLNGRSLGPGLRLDSTTALAHNNKEVQLWLVCRIRSRWSPAALRVSVWPACAVSRPKARK
ncbi:hypothetical protein EMIT0P43_30489 [Pseudomonas jessenii]